MTTSRQDLVSGIKPYIAKSPATISSSTTTNGSVIDTQGFQAGIITMAVGTRTDGTYTLLVEESDAADMSGSVVCSAPNLILPLNGSYAISASNGIINVGWVKGNYRYIRASIVSTGVTSGATLCSLYVQLGTAALNPVSQT